MKIKNSKYYKFLVLLLFSFSSIMYIKGDGGGSITITGSGKKFTDISFCGNTVIKSDAKTKTVTGQGKDKGTAMANAIKARKNAINSLPSGSTVIDSSSAVTCHVSPISNGGNKGGSGNGSSIGGGIIMEDMNYIEDDIYTVEKMSSNSCMRCCSGKNCSYKWGNPNKYRTCQRLSGVANEASCRAKNNKTTKKPGATVPANGCYCCGASSQGCKYVWKKKGDPIGGCAAQSKTYAECTGQNVAIKGYVCKASYTYTPAGKVNNGRAQLPTYKYDATDPNFANISEDAYCLQKGRPGPDSSSWSYTALDNFDISSCKTSGDNYQCGLAEIMCQTMDISVDENGKFTVKNNGKYSYSTVSTALRTWVAYDNSSIHDGGGVNTGGSGDDGFDYYSNTDVYSNSANYFLNKGGEVKKCGNSCPEGSENYGVLCYGDTNEQKNIQGVVDLLQNTRSGTSCLDKLNKTLNGNSGEDGNDATEGELSYGKPGIDIDLDKTSQTANVKVTFSKMKVGTTIVSESTTNVEVPVKYCTEGSAGCTVIIEAFDAKGNKIADGQMGKCAKNYCEVKYKYKQMCEEKTQTAQDNYITAKVTVYTTSGAKGDNKAGALIKNYAKASGEVSQQFVSFDVKGVQDLLNGNTSSGGSTGGTETTTELSKGPVYTAKKSIVCPCDNKKRCDDFKVVNTLPSKCTDYDNFNQGLYDTYDEGKLEEPYMNCIMNACNVSQRNQYDFSKEYGVDVGICRIFCREEVEFYLANKTRVYAGMQFKYKIDEVPGVAKKRKLTNGNSLTSMVLQKRQCASEIYYDHRNPWYNYSTKDSKYDSYIKAGYDTWQKMYGKAVKDMVDAWSSWKAYETLHKKEGWGTCNPYLDHAPDVNCYSSGSGCPSSCPVSQTLPGFDYVYLWPPKGSTVNNTKSDTGNPGYSYNNKSEDTNNKVTFNVNNRNNRPSDQDGKYNQSNGSTSNVCGSYTCTDSKGKKDTCYKYSCTAGAASGCKKGEPGKDKCKVKNQEAALWSAFKAAVNNITQLVYELENCNLYKTEDLKLYYDSASYVDFSGYTPHRPKYQGTYTSAIDGGTTKDYILKLANCKSEKGCISLDLEYADKKYGAETTFGKEVEIVAQDKNIKEQDLTQDAWCINSNAGEKKTGNSYNASCYPGPGNTDVDLTGKNVKGEHDLVSCKGYDTNAQCKVNQVTGEKIELPINDFAIFTVVSEADFWQPKRYSTEVYTGNVFESGSSYGASTTSLPPYVFPVSMDKESGGKTGAYDVKHKYSYVGSALSKAQLLNENYYEFTCQYEVYNITNLYDCKVGTDANKNADLETCNNKCYEIKDGVPIIRDCARWNNRTNDSKGYGFVYRNVELSKLFPAPRKVGNNWYTHDSERKAIESTSSDMYTDSEKYLEYSFILNSDSIKKLRKYNKDRNGAGGYIDNTLRGCTITDGFYNCSSSFLDLIRDDSNSFGIKVNKSDGISRYRQGY